MKLDEAIEVLDGVKTHMLEAANDQYAKIKLSTALDLAIKTLKQVGEPMTKDDLITRLKEMKDNTPIIHGSRGGYTAFDNPDYETLYYAIKALESKEP